MNYSKLFEPVSIGTMQIPNRMVVPSMVTNYCGHDGKATERYLAYHREKARGGWGMVITEAYKVTEDCGGYYNMAGLWTDEQIESHTRLTDIVHNEGGRIVCQLIHGGRQVPEEASGVRGIAPSAVKDPTLQEIPREMTLDDIAGIKDCFVAAAVRAKKTGFDGVEIHAAHGYLLNEFLSAFSNKRADQYGGTLENRARLVMEIIRGTRDAVGKEFPLILRLTTEEYVEGGITLAESRIFAKIAVEAGIDAIHATQGVYQTAQCIIPPCAVPAGNFQDNAAAIKSVVNVPVIAVGRINTPETALEILEENKADLVAMGRASLADPDFPNKLKEGRKENIRLCIGCVQGCIGGINRGNSVTCMVNPRIGRELEFPEEKTSIPKKVLVAGAGVAGMEAAVVAAGRGHDVVVYEESAKAGGQWLAAAVPPGKAEFNSFVFWQKEQLEKGGVKLHLGTGVSRTVLEEEKPDVFVIAVGGQPAVPPIKGIKERKVLTAVEVLTGKEQVSGPAVIIGGGLAGAETAEHLSCHNVPVSIVEMLPQIAGDGEPTSNLFMMENLRKHQVDIYTSAKVLEVTEHTVSIQQEDGSRKNLPADTVILAAGTRSRQLPAGEYENLVKEVYTVGDARKAKNGLANIAEAYETAYQI